MNDDDHGRDVPSTQTPLDDHERVSSPPPMTLQDLAALMDGRVVGDGRIPVTGLAAVEDAAQGEVAFLASPRYSRFVPGSRGAAFLVSDALAGVLPPEASAIVVADPHAALRIGLLHFFPPTVPAPTIHATAVIGRDVVIGAGVTVEPYAVIEDGVTLGSAVHVGAHCVVGRQSKLGDRARLQPHVVLYAHTVLGRDVLVHSGARLGSAGFGFTTVDGESVRMPHVGRCVIGDGVEIGANATIDRGSLGDTVIESGVKIDNLVHIAHNVRVGARSMLAALVGIAGSTRIGSGAWLGGQSGVCNQAELGDGVRVAVQTGVTRDVPAGQTVSGFPGRPHREVLRRDALVARLPRFVERLKKVERAVGEGSG